MDFIEVQQSHRGTSQFMDIRVPSSSTEGDMIDHVTRRPNSHSKRAEILGMIDQHPAHTKGLRPVISERVHVEEGIAAYEELRDTDIEVEMLPGRVYTFADPSPKSRPNLPRLTQREMSIIKRHTFFGAR